MSTQDIVAKLWNPLPFTSGNAKNTIQGVRVLESLGVLFPAACGVIFRCE